MQDFSENGYELAGLEQPVDIRDDDQAIVEAVDQFVLILKHFRTCAQGGWW